MRGRRIGICSRDPDYAASLMMALNRMSGGAIEAVVYSRPEVAVKCRVVQEPDLILLDGFPDPEGNEEDPVRAASGWSRELGVPVVAMTEEPSEQGTLFKYQSVRGICREILGKLQSERKSGMQRSGCIAVFSPLGRCGKTTLARALAAAEADRGGLYIGMEEYPDRTVRSEVLYQIKQRSPDVYEAVAREIVTEGGISCIHLSGMYPDLRDVQKEDLEWFHAQLLQPERYRTLITDVGAAALAGPELLACYDRIYMPLPRGEGVEAKLRQFREYMRERKQGEVLRRIVPLELSAEVVERGDPRELLSGLSA